MNQQRALCFLSGIGVGAAAALLYAPNTGIRTRAMIASKAKKGQRFVKDQSGDLRDSMADALKQGKQTLSHAAESIHTAVETGKKAFGA
jgi:gas vesicle protein